MQYSVDRFYQNGAKEYGSMSFMNWEILQERGVKYEILYQ